MGHRIYGLRSYDTAYPVGVLRTSTRLSKLVTYTNQNDYLLAVVANNPQPVAPQCATLKEDRYLNW